MRILPKNMITRDRHVTAGFHALQKSTAGGAASILGCSCAATGTIFGTLSIWVYADAVNHGSSTPPSFHELGLVANWATFAADLLLAYAIIKAGVYPHWTAVMMLINAILLFVFLAEPSAPVVFAYRLDLLTGSAPQAVIAWYMLGRSSSLSRAT